MIIRATAPWDGVTRDTVMRVFPEAALVLAWADAVRQGRLDLAAAYRRRLEARVGEQPTWEDAEWR